MSSILDMYAEDEEYELWEKMKGYGLDQLHAELTSPDASYRFTAGKELQLRGENATFAYVTTLVRAVDAPFRQVAAFILGQLGTPNRPFLRQSIPMLTKLLNCDFDSRVRAAAAAALGHLGSPESFECLKRSARDDDAEVRANVAFALGKIQDERSVQPLLLLTHDNDSEVVYWAILGLQSLNIDSPLIRSRFIEMLSDARENIRDEVICGLANWRDIRVLPALLDALNRKEVNFDLFNAAGNLGDIRVLPRLKALLKEWGDDSPKMLHQVISKLETCCRAN